MPRKRFSEDVLVRALDFCDERGLRLGQLLVNVVRERIDTLCNNGAVQQALFYMENERLEEWITEFIDKANRKSALIASMAREAVEDGAYDIVPDEYVRPSHDPL